MGKKSSRGVRASTAAVDLDTGDIVVRRRTVAVDATVNHPSSNVTPPVDRTHQSYSFDTASVANSGGRIVHDLYDNYVDDEMLISDDLINSSDSRYLRLLEHPEDMLHFISVSTPPSSRTRIFVLRDYHSVDQRLMESKAVIVVLRRVRCADADVFVGSCQCEQLEPAGLAATKALIFEDRANMSQNQLSSQLGGCHSLLYGCRHKRAVLSLLVSNSSEDHHQVLSRLLPEDGALLPPTSLDLACVIRSVVNDVYKYFLLKKKDGKSGRFVDSRVAVGVKNEQLALGYWTGSKIICMACNAPECGHFRENRSRYIDQEIDGGRSESTRSIRPLARVPLPEKIFAFDPGRYIIQVRSVRVRVLIVTIRIW